MQHPLFLSRIVLGTALLLAGAGCAGPASGPATDGSELALEMGDVQRFADKLGRSIDARNPRLARFYFDKLDQSLKGVATRHPEFNGYPVAQLIEDLSIPAGARVRSALSTRDWTGASNAFGKWIDTCNSCHAATEREFIVIAPRPQGEPYLQEFSPSQP